MPKPLKKTKELWDDFIKWLKNKAIMIICNFSKMHISKYQISNEGKYVKEVNDNVTKVYCKSIEIYGREKYIEIQDEVTVEMRNVIGNMNTNGQMTIESIFPLKKIQEI